MTAMAGAASIGVDIMDDEPQDIGVPACESYPGHGEGPRKPGPGLNDWGGARPTPGVRRESQDANAGAGPIIVGIELGLSTRGGMSWKSPMALARRPRWTRIKTSNCHSYPDTRRSFRDLSAGAVAVDTSVRIVHRVYNFAWASRMLLTVLSPSTEVRSSLSGAPPVVEMTPLAALHRRSQLRSLPPPSRSISRVASTDVPGHVENPTTQSFAKREWRMRIQYAAVSMVRTDGSNAIASPRYHLSCRLFAVR